MVLRYLRFALVFAATAALVGYVAMLDWLERGFSWVASAFTPVPRFAFDGARFEDHGTPLDSAVQNSLRHEAGMRPLRC